MSLPAKKSRKPSVLVSRQFTCTNAFNNDDSDNDNDDDNDDDDDQTTSTTATSNKKNVFTVSVRASRKSQMSSSRNRTRNRNRNHAPKKIIWNGRDATPRPLVGGGGGSENNENALSFQDINTFFENYDTDCNSKKGMTNDTNPLDRKVVGVPWIPTVMEEFCHSFLRENDTELEACTINDGRSNSQKQQHTIIVGRAPPQDCSSFESVLSNDHDDNDNDNDNGNEDNHHSLVEVHLQETETMEALAIPSSSIPTTSTYYKDIKGRNEQYETACLHQRKECPKNFKERAAQTFHLYQLNESTQTETSYRDVGVGVEDDCQGDHSKRDAFVENLIEELTSAAIMTEGCLLDVSEGIRPGYNNDNDNGNGNAFSYSGHGTKKDNLIPKSASYADIVRIKAKKRFFESDSVLQKLSIVERAIQQNNYSAQQIKYRGVPLVPELMKQEEVYEKTTNDCGDSLELLFTLKCDMTSNMKVSCMSWNTMNTDLLAVGYGKNRDSIREEGLVMLWSTRNPEHPEKLFKISSSVTAIDFASEKPEMVAVGLYDGRILIFDTMSQPSLSTALLDSAFSPGRHMAAVSEIRWVVDKHQSSPEKLISISVDGRVLQWSLKKGLSVSPLMSLKRYDVNLSKGKLPNIALGLSMDFSGDGISYLTGSDDGSLNRCSRSYSERPLSIVKAHNGPLTSIKFSPFSDSVFITGASDSTVKIHSIVQKKEAITELVVVRPVDLIGAVNDVAWSPQRPTLFTLVAQDGRMELWDISNSLLDPLLSLSQQISSDTKPSKAIERTAVRFSACGDAIIVGDNDGTVNVYRVELSQPKTVELYEILNDISKRKGLKDNIMK